LKFILWLLLTLNSQGAVDATCVKHVVPPGYPHLARAATLQGTVTVEIDIDPDGTVTSERSSGANELLRRASEDNIAQWMFCPASGAAGSTHGSTPLTRTSLDDLVRLRLLEDPDPEGTQDALPGPVGRGRTAVRQLVRHYGACRVVPGVADHGGQERSCCEAWRPGLSANTMDPIHGLTKKIGGVVARG